MTYSKWTSLALSLSLALVGASACGDDDEATPNVGKDSSVPSFTSDARVEDDVDGGTDPTDDEDGGEPTTDDDGSVGEDPDGGGQINCDDPSGCYACTPTTNLQFLNACVAEARGISQLTFDNVERIPDFDPATPFPAL